MSAESQAAVVPDALLFVREGTLFRQSFDGRRLSGEASGITEHVLQNPISARANFAASSDGRVVLVRPADSGVHTLTWFKRDGSALGTLGSAGIYFEPRISPDGGKVVFERPDGDHGNRDLWTIDTRNGTTLRLTTNPGNDLQAEWSPDGRRILFASDRDGGPYLQFYEKSASEADGERKTDLGLPDARLNLMDWSHDGRWLALAGHARPDTDIVIASATGDRKAFAFFQSRFIELFPRFSPDGKWIAYVSDESGRQEVYVRAFAGGPAAGSPAVQISNNNGNYPVWSRDGAELYYIASDFKIYSVSTRDLKPGALPPSAPLFTACPATQPIYEALGGYPFDAGPDGRFLVVCRAGLSSFVVTVNDARLTRR